MTQTEAAAATAGHWRPMILSGGIGLAAASAAFALFLPFDVFAAAAAAAIGATFGAAIVTTFIAIRTRRHNKRMLVALHTMSQAPRPFDGNERLVFSNTRYNALYRLSDAVAKPGTPLIDILAFRAANGTFMNDPTEFRRQLLADMAQGKPTGDRGQIAGRALSSFATSRLRMAAGSGSHDDITDQRDAEAERAAIQNSASAGP